MKTNIRIYLIAIMALFSFTAAQPDADITQQVASAIRSGNAAELAKYFNTTVDITLPSSEGSYSKAQAEMMTKSFFQKYPPVSFTINNQGTSKGGMRYVIGTLTTKTTSFRTYFMMKDAGGQTWIQQLQFENQ